MLTARRRVHGSARAERLRPKARACRPRAEVLESRALLALLPGNPVSLTPTAFMGVGTTAAQTALTQFQTAIGGVKNTAASPQSGGFRSITWDGVKLDGTDFGGGANTTVVNLNKTVLIPQNRFVGQGIFLSAPGAVSGDGFADVNPTVGGATPLFPAFSTPNIFAAPNSNTISLSFNLPTANNGTPVPAATRGFGAIFLNVELAGTSSIQYFDGNQSLGTFDVPAGTQGQAEFLGELFPNAVVTSVTLTLGNDTIFGFDGVTATSGPANVILPVPPGPVGSINLVANDDFDYAEPVPLAVNSIPPILSGPAGTLNAPPLVLGTVGTALPATTVAATFSDTTAGAVAANYTAVINWGDGHISNGTVVADGQGGFAVEGSNTYFTAGLTPITVNVEKLGTTPASISLTNTAQIAAANTTTTLAVSTATTQINQPVTLTATVAAAGATPNNGFVEFEDGSNILGVDPVTNGMAALTTSSLTSGSHSLTAVYLGNFNFNSSTSAAVSETVLLDVTSQFSITLGAIKKRGGKFIQIDTLQNTGGTLIGPITLVLQGLPSKATLLGAGKTTTFFPGSPFIVVTGGALVHNQSISITLIFKAKSKGLITYKPHVLAGIAQP